MKSDMMKDKTPVKTLVKTLVITGPLLIPWLISAKGLSSGESIHFKSINNTEEVCLKLPPIPGGIYSKKDTEQENKLCAIDFYHQANTALCPKTWSTSPSTMIYDTNESPTNKLKIDFENNECAQGKKNSGKKLAKFKNTMYETKTSSTYSKSGLVYYHLSRNFETSLHIPVAVYREMDAIEHLKISEKGAKLASGGAIKQGWLGNINAHQKKSQYNMADYFFANNTSLVQGVLIKDSGEQVGAEIDGIGSEWGKKATIDFSNTPAFMALKLSKPVEQSIQDTLKNYHEYLEAEAKKHKGGLFGRGNSEAYKKVIQLQKILPQLNVNIMKIWMNDITEIVILDTILGQEDRHLNIDFKWVKYSLKNDKFEQKTLDDKRSFVEYSKIQAENPNEIIAQKIHLNDNDAGLFPAFTNFFKDSKLIEKIHHISYKNYHKVISLQLDLKNKGEIYTYLKETLGLTEKELIMLQTNTDYVAETLKTKCLTNALYFDLNSPEDLLKKTTNSEAKVSSCTL